MLHQAFLAAFWVEVAQRFLRQAMGWIEDLFPSYHPNIRKFILLRLGFFDRRLKWGQPPAYG